MKVFEWHAYFHIDPLFIDNNQITQLRQTVFYRFIEAAGDMARTRYVSKLNAKTTAGKDKSHRKVSQRILAEDVLEIIICKCLSKVY